MAFDTRSGFCLTSGPPAPAAPFAPQLCFQTAYVPNFSVDNQAFSWAGMGCNKNKGNGQIGGNQTNSCSSGSCIRNGNTVGACQYDEECGPGASCHAGQCWPNNQPHSPWWYDNGNPRITTDVGWDQVASMMNAMGMTDTFEAFAQKYAFGKSMFIVQHKGQEFLAVPLNIQYFKQDPQCSTCLKSVWQCDRFADASRNGDPEAMKLYHNCIQFQDCFLFDTMRPDGVIIPIMIKVDPVSLGVATAALQKCAMHCGDVLPNTPLARGQVKGLYHQ
jgi:hypothetical protein